MPKLSDQYDLNVYPCIPREFPQYWLPSLVIAFEKFPLVSYLPRDQV